MLAAVFATHCPAARVERHTDLAGDWLVLSGSIPLKKVVWIISKAYQFEQWIPQDITLPHDDMVELIRFVRPRVWDVQDV